MRRRAVIFTIRPIRRLLLYLPLALLLLLHRPQHPTPPRQAKNALLSCFTSPKTKLSSFDPFLQSLNSPQNTIENRWQQTVWDTILPQGVYPAWSDMSWSPHQFGNKLPEDLALLQALAASAQHAHFASAPASPPAFQARASPVRVRYVHRRLDRLRGLQYVVGYASRRVDGEVYTMLVEKPIDNDGGGCRVAIAEGRFEGPVYVILPYAAREERLRLFLYNFRDLQVRHGESAVLIVSVLRERVKDVRFVETLVREVFNGTGKSGAANSVWIHRNSGDIRGKFSRAVALRDAAKLVPDETAVMFHCDVDLHISPMFLARCAQNAILHEQVYFPVMYSLYATGGEEIGERKGFWRTTSFGMVCVRKGDFESVGAFNDAERRFRGWGGEDVVQFEKVRRAGLVGFRAVEPGLVHRWHAKICEEGSDRFVDCVKARFVGIGVPVEVGEVLMRRLGNLGVSLEGWIREG